MIFGAESNETTESWHYGPVSTALIVYAGCVSVILTVVGNILVCLAVVLVRKLRQQPPNYLLFSLAVTDFGVGVIVQPLNILNELNGGRWTMGAFMCRLYTTADLTFCTASILTLCAINVDRYLAISKPFTYCTKRTVKRCLSYVMIAWIMALLISATPLVLMRQEPLEPSYICQIPSDIMYQIYATLGAFYVPACIILVVNYKIIRAARRLTRHDRSVLVESQSCFQFHVNNNNNNNNNNAKNNNDYESKCDRPKNLEAKKILVRELSTKVPQAVIVRKYSKKSPVKVVARGVVIPRERWSRASGESTRFAEMWQSLKKSLSRTSSSASGRQSNCPRRPLDNETKAMKTLGVVTGAFIIGWLPFFVLALVKAVCTKIECNLEVPGSVDCLLAWLGYLNSAINPFIYAKYNRDFRIPFREMLCCRFSTLKTVLRREDFIEHYGFSSPRCSNPNPGSNFSAPSQTGTLNRGHDCESVLLKSCSTTATI